MASERFLVRDAIGSFAPGQSLRAALLLTYSFDGAWIEEGFVPDLFDRDVSSALVIRDARRIVTEAPTVLYHRANAGFSHRVFHPKLGLFVAEDRALVIIGSANLTRGGLERNLELGSVFEVNLDGGPRTLFEDILSYVSGPLCNEVGTHGSPATALRDTAIALREILTDVPEDRDSPHRFLHNYEQTLWQQVLEAIPHRHVARLSIISPFFEPNAVHPEDPIEEAEVGMFERALTDLTLEPPVGKKPIHVYFQQSEGRTLLPLDKLSRWKDKVELFQRLATSDDLRPLHGKLLLIEGAAGKRRRPYMFALYGSPNFTSAAYLARPPGGNAEVAVLTELPPRRTASERVRTALGLERLFATVVDWTTLRHVPPEREPAPATEIVRIVDATLRVAEQKLEVLWRGTAVGATRIRALVEIDGAKTVIGAGDIGQQQRVVLSVPELLTIDQHNILSLKSSFIWIEFLDADGGVIASSVIPVNVDCPGQFVGRNLVGTIMSSLDARIAFAGCGAGQTYRQKQDFLERLRSQSHLKGGRISLPTHQADLDRFFRNVRTGFRGVRMRLERLPNSEFTFRRTVKDLTRWCQEVVAKNEESMTIECRLFLINHLVREFQRTLESGENSRTIAPRLETIAEELQLRPVLKSVREWIRTVGDRQIRPYAKDVERLLATVTEMASSGFK